MQARVCIYREVHSEAFNRERKMDMFNIQKVEREIGGKVITLETGRIARQAHGAVLAAGREDRAIFAGLAVLMFARAIEIVLPER